MGVGGMALHQWVFGTKTFQKMAADFAGSLIGDEVGREGVDDDFAARGFENIGAWIMGRNMFGPVRGPWPDDSWKGWWGKNPPYHVPFQQPASLGPREVGSRAGLPDGQRLPLVAQKYSQVPSVGSWPTPGFEKSHTPLGKIALSWSASADVNDTL